jgi:hypothetical protein
MPTEAIHVDHPDKIIAAVKKGHQDSIR